jgi:hypothetical protein
MEATTSGRFRVLAGPRDRDGRDEFLLVEVADGDPDDATASGGDPDASAAEEAFDPVSVQARGYEGPLSEAVDALRPGYVIEATLEWAEGTARFLALSVLERTRFEFVDGVTGVFEAARETWQDAATAGEAMNSRVTHGTDGQPNGVLYTFAKQEGARDLFEEFQRGLLPLEPLITRANAALESGPREVFVMRPVDESFVLVYIVFEKGGVLARTVRETYDIQ